jgi:hypothetical protein
VNVSAPPFLALCSELLPTLLFDLLHAALGSAKGVSKWIEKRQRKPKHGR